MTSILLSYLSTGINDSENAEEKRKSYLINSFIFIALLYLVPFGVNSMLHGFTRLGLTLFLAAFLLLLAFLILKYTYNQTLVACMISSMFFLLMVYLVSTGGVDNTGPLWIYFLPMVYMFLLGFKRGIFYISIFIITLLFILFSGNESLLYTSYSLTFKVRLLLTFLVVTLLAGAYEYSRKVTFEQIEKLSEELKVFSQRDYLTKVYNRRGMHNALICCNDLHKKQNKAFSLLLCDIDFFKQVNDTYGHDVGDDILKRVALEIHNTIREEDIIARWGGEEFLILLPQCGLRDAYNIAEKIRKKIESISFEHISEDLRITVSIGLSQHVKEKSVSQTIQEADKQMYQAKEDGRNIVYPLVS